MISSPQIFSSMRTFISNYQISKEGLPSKEGDVILDGWSGKPCRFCCPRDDEFAANIITDHFALGCNIYSIMNGHAVYPDIIDGEDGWREKVIDRFASSCSHRTLTPVNPSPRSVGYNNTTRQKTLFRKYSPFKKNSLLMRVTRWLLDDSNRSRMYR